MAGAGRAAVSGVDEIRVLRVDRDSVRLPGRGAVRAIVWPGMGARHRSMHYVCLPAGGASDEWRHRGEAVSDVLSGSGWFEDRATGARHEVRAGLIAHVEAGTPYAMRARAAGLRRRALSSRPVALCGGAPSAAAGGGEERR